MAGHAREINEGQRFQFGKNWSNFLAVLNEDRIAVAGDSLKSVPPVKLTGRVICAV